MKSLNTIKIILISSAVLFCAVWSMNLRTGSGSSPAPVASAVAPPLQTTSSQANVANVTQLIANLFKDPTHPPECKSDKPSKEDEQANAVNITEDGTVWNLPRQKVNFHEKKKLGWDASAYLFDYLDDILQKDIVTEFDRIFKDAQKIQPQAGFKDPYSLDKMLNLNGANIPPKEELYKKIASVSPSFNPSIWETSISIGQIETIIKDWSWYANPSKPDPAKYIVDKYDYDGDGRLNSREFIIAMIRNNKRVVDGAKKCKNCLENIISTKIDPMYIYLDCGAKDQITSEQMWTGFATLKRSSLNYDIYKCTLDGGKYRTSAINDFVLKSQKIVEGKLTKEEFRLGLLTGYWDRQTDNTKVFLDDGHNMKKMRWAGDGQTDIVCERIKASIEKNKGF